MLMVYVQKVYEEKLRDREKYTRKKNYTRNKLGSRKVV